MVSIDTLDAHRWTLASRLADSWQRQQSADVYAALYLYHKPGNGKRAGMIMVQADAADGFELSHARRIGPDGTLRQWTNWIAEALRGLPIGAPDSDALAMAVEPRDGQHKELRQ